MAIILYIHTAVGTASICLAKGSEVLRYAENNDQKDHAAWIHPQIEEMLKETGLKKEDIEAVATTIGPGSYTGLRVGLATAKGICFALRIPLIAINTLKLMADAVRDKKESGLFCPLIDARRMEVFTAVYDSDLKEVLKPCAMILDGSSFDELLKDNTVMFIGNGVLKLQKVLFHPNAHFSGKEATAADMTRLGEMSFNKKEFADLAYTEPLYLKEFYSPAR